MDHKIDVLNAINSQEGINSSLCLRILKEIIRCRYITKRQLADALNASINTIYAIQRPLLGLGVVSINENHVLSIKSLCVRFDPPEEQNITVVHKANRENISDIKENSIRLVFPL